MFRPNSLTTTIVSISLTKKFLKSSEKSMAGIPLMEDRRMSPSSMTKPPLKITSPDSETFLPIGFFFQETSLIGIMSTTILSIESFPTSLNLTFLVLHSSSVNVSIQVRSSDETVKAEAIIYFFSKFF
ncbi:hypothetical protein ES332_A08G138800v1 [Gossypium tomentosum]|uniref:Uncharacterized protein n=1 Tax=Gossypium tomentosum TaxID=34277 RepID=A0A5D2PEW3_GOSTO|nr:hypothetical protein ES332_A08G138800v1 [Gossypium tomentosum]